METNIIKTVEEFFKRRFPDKDIKFEKKCGYFGEWIQRFESGHPEEQMDEKSLEVWRQMQEERIGGIEQNDNKRTNI